MKFQICAILVPLKCALAFFPKVKFQFLAEKHGLRIVGVFLTKIEAILCSPFYSLLLCVCVQLVESEAVAERCRNSCAEQRIPFYRFSPQMECKMDPGETDNAKLLNMIIAAKIHAHQGSQMDKLILLLLTWAPSP